MPNAVIYPSSIITDKAKLFACYSLIEQLRLEHNKVSAIATSDKEKYIESGKLRAYAQQAESLLKQLLAEQNRLKESIIWANYTPKQWEALNNLTPQELITLHQTLFGNKSAESTKPTTATSPALDDLKALSLDDMPAKLGADPTEDYTTYTEVDETSALAITANRITYTAAKAIYNTYYVYKDKGAAHFNGNFEHRVKHYCSAMGNYLGMGEWQLSNVVGDEYYLRNNYYDLLDSKLYYDSASGRCQFLQEYDNAQGIFYDYNQNLWNLSTVYYITDKRDEGVGTYGTIYSYLCTGNYYGESGYNLIDTLSVALHSSKKDFRYIASAVGFDYNGNQNTCTGYIELLDLQEISAYELSITEGLKAGDTPVRTMTASVSVTEGLKGGDSFDKTALMSLLASDGFKGGDAPALLAQMLPVLSEGIKLGESLSIQLGTLQQSFYPITPVEVTPGTAGSWQDVDVSAYVPAGATGVILHCVNNSTNTMRYFGFRKNGSTDARTDSLSYGTHVWATIGVDSSRIFEAYIQDITDIDVWLVGYTTSGVTFFTNAYDKSPSVLSNWEDIDCSTEAPNAIGLIFEIQNTGSLASFGLRKYGSSDNRVVQTVGYNTFAVIIGCDTAQKCQGQITDSNIKVYLVGYVTQGAIFNTNATDVSLSSTGSWIDLAALPTGSVMGFIEATSLASTNRFGLRKNGSSEAIYKYCYRHPFAMVECDSSGIIEGEISNTDVDFFLVGYAVSSLVLIITLTDGLKFGDSSVLNILRYLALTDGLKLGDSALTVIVKLLLLLEGLKAGDTIAVAMTAGKTLTDGLKLGDLPTEFSQAWLSLAEGGKFGDSEIINLIGVMYYLTLADGLKLGDSTLRTLTALLQLVDGFKLGDVPLYSTIGELLMAWALAQSYYYVTTEVKPYFQITTEAKSYFDVTTRTGVE